MCGMTVGARPPRPTLALQLCRDRGYPFVRLDGSTTIKKRNKLVCVCVCVRGGACRLGCTGHSWAGCTALAGRLRYYLGC